ncbi:MAG TPA: hypothetical protein VF744_13125 [Beijerinckiaceae bacterium]|jgi:hypothetical protein
MASRGVERTHTEKQALKQHTRKAERQATQKEGRRRDFVNEIEFNNAATGGHVDDPIPTRPNSRSAVADQRRAAEKGTGVMSISKKIDPDIKVSGVRDSQGRMSARVDGTKTSRGAKSADRSLDKGSLRMASPTVTSGRTPGGNQDAKGASRDPGATLVRRTKSNAEIADGVTTTAKRSPAPRAAQADGAGTVAPRTMNKRTGNSRQRVPAPGNVVFVPKGELISGVPEAKKSGVRSTASSGGSKPPKRPARAGKGGGAAKPKGADMGIGE